jgi:hypothetical protein
VAGEAGEDGTPQNRSYCLIEDGALSHAEILSGLHEIYPNLRRILGSSGDDARCRI